VWNIRDEADEFTAEYSRLVRSASNNHPAETRITSVEPLLFTPHFLNTQHQSFTYRQEMDLFGLIGRAQSTSYIPTEGPAHQELIADLQRLHERACDERGLVCLVYRTEVYLAFAGIQ